MKQSERDFKPEPVVPKTRVFELPYQTRRRIRLERRFRASRALAPREPTVKAEAA